jgi:acetyl esterase/lipase
MASPTPSKGSDRRSWSKRRIALVIVFLLSTLLPLFLSGVGLLLSVWVVVPAPNFTLLPLGIGAPEFSPWLMGVNAIALLLSLWRLPQGWIYSLALVCSGIGLILSSLPLVQLSATNAQFAGEMRSGLGENYLNQIPASLQRQMRQTPFDGWDFVRGIPLPEVRITRDIPFAAPAGVPLKLNLYRPRETGSYPAIVVIYGGAWQSGSPANDELFSRYMAGQGYTVVAIDYRHAPSHTFPAQIDDVRTALSYIRQYASDLEVNLERLAIMGRSAGAHLAMLAAYQTSDLPIRAVVNYYGPVDLAEGYRDPPRPDPINTRKVLTTFLGCSPAECPDLYKQASPLTYVTRPLPPSLLVYSGRDHLVQARFGRQLHTQLRATGTPSVLLEIPWAEHAFDAVFNGVSNQVALYYTERFLAAVLLGEKSAVASKELL